MLKDKEGMESNPVIIGAGTIGCYLAKKLSALNPILIEEHKKIGLPVHCTGLISKRIFDIAEFPKNIVLNKIRNARIFSPDGNSCVVGGEERAYVFDRRKLDEYLSKGLSILHEKYISHEAGNNYIEIKTSKSKIKTKLMIDCSGASSEVFGKIKSLVGIQYVVKMKHMLDEVELHFGDKICPGFFAWVVPVDEDTCRIGLATERNAGSYMKKFYSKFNSKIIEKQAGLIPMGKKNFYSDNLIAVGDSASHTKKTTGGGVVTGMISADIASESIIKSYHSNNFSSNFFRINYYNRWRKGIGKEILIHEKIRKSLNKMSDKEYESMVKFLLENKDLINKHGDMELISSLIPKLITLKNLPFLLSFFLKAL
ncbi:MAG: NAD(P)/FAD-dependent oxidoreductase [Candidatus Nanoarchaeia archaeon]|nr:NAD(P)/FAD-dependent oxidoreductase [Candidatus Nanoarchaeia archaeon]